MTRLIIESAVLSGLALAGLMIAAGANAYVVQLLFSTALAVTLAVGWNLIGGMAGYVSFGQVGFFGLGAYAGALAMLKWALPWPLAIVLAACLAAFLAWPLGRIMLRLSGIFFALGMFGLARVLQIIVNALEITGGPMGTSDPHRRRAGGDGDGDGGAGDRCGRADDGDQPLAFRAASRGTPR